MFVRMGAHGVSAWSSSAAACSIPGGWLPGVLAYLPCILINQRSPGRWAIDRRPAIGTLWSIITCCVDWVDVFTSFCCTLNSQVVFEMLFTAAMIYGLVLRAYAARNKRINDYWLIDWLKSGEWLHQWWDRNWIQQLQQQWWNDNRISLYAYFSSVLLEEKFGRHDSVSCLFM